MTSIESGIYKITNISNSKCYIGSAIDLKGRFRVHRHLLKNGKHNSIHLQRSWDKHGENIFSFEILLLCSIKDLLFYEQKAIDVYRPNFNICPFAGNGFGKKWGEHCNQGRENIRRANTGRIPWNKGKTGIYSEETRLRISESGKGRVPWCAGKKLSDEHKRKLSEAKIGKKCGSMPDKTKQKLREANLGRKRSLEMREKMRIAKEGKYCGENNPFYGKKHSQETIEKIKEKRKNQIFTLETREKLSSSIKLLWEKCKLIKYGAL